MAGPIKTDHVHPPDLRISPEAIEAVRVLIASWPGDPRDISLALTTMGTTMLQILDGRTDHIALYEAAAKKLIRFPIGVA